MYHIKELLNSSNDSVSLENEDDVNVEPAFEKEWLASTVHNIMASYSNAIHGEGTMNDWDSAPDDQKTSTRDGVQFLVDHPDADAKDSHDNWIAYKEAHGWEYGDTKDEDALTHPMMVPFDDLADEEKAKDHLFVSIVRNLQS